MKSGVIQILALCGVAFMVSACMCSSTSNNAAWDRMETEEYNRSLEREMSLR